MEWNDSEMIVIIHKNFQTYFTMHSTHTVGTSPEGTDHDVIFFCYSTMIIDSLIESAQFLAYVSFITVIVLLSVSCPFHLSHTYIFRYRWERQTKAILSGVCLPFECVINIYLEERWTALHTTQHVSLDDALFVYNF